MTVPSLTNLPAAPQRTDAPATFVTKADAFLGAVVTFQTEMNASVAAFNTDFTTVDDNATIAATSATNAVAAATAADNSSNATLWASGTSYSEGDVVYSPIDYQSYRANTAYSGTTDPSLSTDWTQVSGNYNVPAAGTKTSSYTLVKQDVGKYVQVGTGGSVTIPDAIFAEGDVVSIFNNTSGDVTITCSITTAYKGGADADVASITLATRGLATILFISGTECVVAGNI